PLRLYVNILTLLMMHNTSIFYQKRRIFLALLTCVLNVILSLVIVGERLRKDKNQAPLPPGKHRSKVVTIGIIVLVVAFIISVNIFSSESSVFSAPMAALQLLYVIFHFSIRKFYPIHSRFCKWITGGLVGACVLTIAAFLFFTWEMN
ncbi:hypothetical protein PFISCL1PPCAC_8502, partial [Pristionchus fissidentatus]